MLNGGMFGYGPDQIVLRGEQLLDGAASAADVVIPSVLPEDVLRCEFSYRYAWEPYFEIEGGRLALRNVPVPEPHVGRPGESLVRRALRRSFVADRIPPARSPTAGASPTACACIAGDVARLLIDRLAESRARPVASGT